MPAEFSLVPPAPQAPPSRLALDQLWHRVSPGCQQRLLNALSRIVRQQAAPQPKEGGAP